MKIKNRATRRSSLSGRGDSSQLDQDIKRENVIDGEVISEATIAPSSDGVSKKTLFEAAKEVRNSVVDAYHNRYYWLQNSLFITAIAIILQYHLNLDPFSGANLLITLFAFAITALYQYMHELHVLERKYEPLHRYIDGLIKLFSHVSPQLEEHVELQIENSIKSLNALSEGATVEATYHDQIAIANSLAKDTHTRFWAVSTDKPSKLWKESYYYFDTQERINASYKARLVVLEWDDLLDDYQVNGSDFEHFVSWHQSNKFDLKFYIVESAKDFQDMVIQSVGAPVHDKDTLSDFLIKDSDCVYGRVDFDPRTDRVRLKFIPYAHGDNMDKYSSYCQLFESLIKRGQSASEIRQQLDLDTQRAELANQSRMRNSQARKDYAEEFKNATQGEDFYRLMCTKIASASKSLVAVDVADMKHGVQCWAYQQEYTGFLDATIITAKRNVLSQRIYIIKKLSYLNAQVEQMWIKQLNAGVELALLDNDTVTQGRLYVEDSILVDNQIGFHLGEELFEQDTLEFGKNLIPRGALNLYHDFFESLYTHKNTAHFFGARDIDKLKQFVEKHNARNEDTTDITNNIAIAPEINHE